MKRVLIGVAVAVAVAGATVVEAESTRSVIETLEAWLAAMIAVAVAAFALTLPNISWRGVLIGGFFVGAGMLSWSYTDDPIVVWGFLAVEGVVFAVLSYPWVRDLPALARLGSAWLGLAYWLLGIVGAVLILKLNIAAQRVAYAGVFTLAALAVVASLRRRRPGRDLSIGIVVAFLLAIAALLLSGSGNLFDPVHAVPETGWGNNMNYRFWGGDWLLYHPNSLALLGVAVAVRIGADPAFAIWRRVAVTGLAGVVLLLSDSRTGFLFATAAAGMHGLLLLWRDRSRPALVSAAVPFVMLALVFAISGGTNGFLLKSRYGGGDATSGRVDTWIAVFDEWREAGPAEKAFGDAQTARAVVIRPDSPGLKLTTDNAAVGALRRGGVLGVLAFLLGLALLLWHAVRRGPRWFTILAVASLPTIATADWLLGGTGGTLWILLLAAEAAGAYAPTDSEARSPEAEPEPVGPSPRSA